MNKGERTVSDRLDVKGKEISRILNWYFDGEVWVNRKYQRKLVWTLQEKKDFIDSILNKLPTPSMILASYDEQGVHKFEIIDGLQRLNAIISFAVGEFSVPYEGEECYFNMKVYHRFMPQLLTGELIQKEPVLPEKVSDIFLEYELPLILTEQSPEKVEQIFNRINSSGKKLSAQDIRQSSSCDAFADLVRRVSCYARHEFSFDDLVNLSDLPKISVSGKGLPYGVDSREIFWRRHNIITYDNLKQSRDEELIAQILGEVFIPDLLNPSSDSLDRMYKEGDRYNFLLNKNIKEIGVEYLEEKMRNIFNVINMVFNSVDSNFSSWVFSDKKSKNKNDCFRIFFLALFNLDREGYSVQNYKEFAYGIKSLSDSILSPLISVNFVTKQTWNNVYTSVYRFLKPLTSKVVLHESSEEEKEIKKRLLKSSVESQMTEYKISLTDFKNGVAHEDTIHRIGITLSAMANTKSSEEGFVIIGVADNVKAGREWESAFDKSAIIYNDHYVTGISEEAVKYFHNIDHYINHLRKCLSKEPLDQDLKEYVLANFQEIDFEDRKLILILSKDVGHTVKYNGVVYKRYGNSNVKA